jgi:hypothetical protein
MQFLALLGERTDARGHDVRLLPTQYVKAYLKRQKNDAADAEAICEAVTRPTMRFVPVKTLGRPVEHSPQPCKPTALRGFECLFGRWGDRWISGRQRLSRPASEFVVGHHNVVVVVIGWTSGMLPRPPFRNIHSVRRAHGEFRSSLGRLQGSSLGVVDHLAQNFERGLKFRLGDARKHFATDLQDHLVDNLGEP